MSFSPRMLKEGDSLFNQGGKGGGEEGRGFLVRKKMVFQHTVKKRK